MDICITVTISGSLKLHTVIQALTTFGFYLKNPVKWSEILFPGYLTIKEKERRIKKEFLKEKHKSYGLFKQIKSLQIS